jgi:hypothetical protein
MHLTLIDVTERLDGCIAPAVVVVAAVVAASGSRDNTLRIVV